jgi:sec-independent protein translocase protein TatB
MMTDMSFSETIFLFVLALIIFGPKKLPEIARQVGKYLNEFKRASNEFKAQIEQEISNLEVEKKPTLITTSHAPEGTNSRSLNPAATEAVAGEPPVGEPVTATLAAPAAENSAPISSASEPETANAESTSPADVVISSETHA